MPATKSEISIHPNTVNVANTAKLLQKVVQELYQKNLEISREQSRLDELMSRVAEIIFAVDQNHKITLFNATAEAIFAISEIDALGKNPDEIIKIYNHKTNNQILIQDYAFKTKMFALPKVNISVGEDPNTFIRYYSLKSNYVDYDTHNREAIISLADITREVEIENLKDDFISIASHELKTPVSIIKNHLWMLNNTLKIDFGERGLRYISEMFSGLERLSRIVNELLNVSRIDQNRMIIEITPEDADTIITETLDKFVETFKTKNINFVGPKNINTKILIDKMKFGEVIDNYISNAIKYCNPQASSVKMSLEKTTDNMLKINVSDNGQGIERKDFPKIFTKFGRAEAGLKLVSPGASTGLGLYICKYYVEGMGGKVGFESEVGNGSNFWFTAKLEQA